VAYPRSGEAKLTSDNMHAVPKPALGSRMKTARPHARSSIDHATVERAEPVLCGFYGLLILVGPRYAIVYWRLETKTRSPRDPRDRKPISAPGRRAALAPAPSRGACSKHDVRGLGKAPSGYVNHATNIGGVQ
jgi:hypothetical protein